MVLCLVGPQKIMTETKMTYLKAKTRVVMNQPPHLKGLRGIIVGRATDGQPIIGVNYIIKPDGDWTVNSDTYPYEYFTAFECMFDLEKPEKVFTLYDALKTKHGFTSDGAEDICETVKNWLPKKRQRDFTDSYSAGFDDALDLVNKLLK
jgi:hypothetical protein